jgi:putative methylase
LKKLKETNNPKAVDMKNKKLEMTLEKIEGFETPDAAYEQYKTPAAVAAPFLHLAYMSGDIENKTVYDFGCGTGILAIGAALLGAKKVMGFDIDKKAVICAVQNKKRIEKEMEKELPIEFVQTDISEISDKIVSKELETADAVLMNPPFGAQEKGNDRPFLKAACDAGNVIYSIHNKGSYDFIEKFIKPAVITNCFITDFPIRKTFEFHKKESQTIQVEIYRIETSANSRS